MLPITLKKRDWLCRAIRDAQPELLTLAKSSYIGELGYTKREPRLGFAIYHDYINKKPFT